MIGKRVFGSVYIHKSVNVEDAGIPQDKYAEALARLPSYFRYDVIKWDRRSGRFSFVASPDFDTADEPVVGDSCTVFPDGTLRYRRASASNPQIYHGKHLMVASDYDGFHLGRAAIRWNILQGLNVDKTRIGFKKYWDDNVKWILDADEFMDGEVDVANGTARSSGCVGGKAVTPRWVAENIDRESRILDYGAGPKAIHAQWLRSNGFNVDAFEFGANYHDGVHVENLFTDNLIKNGPIYDVVFASNVLNVQQNMGMVRLTLAEIRLVLKDKGLFAFNYPKEPRKMDLTEERLLALVMRMVGPVKSYTVGSSKVFVARARTQEGGV